MGNCAYRDVPATAADFDNPAITYHYARPVFDWSRPADELAPLIRWTAPRHTAPGLCGVYVIAADGADFCKIGISDTPGYRLAQLQTGNWNELSIRSVLWVYGAGNAAKVEAGCHFSARDRGAEVRREWVRISPDEAAILVLEVASAFGVEACGTEGIEMAVKDEVAARAQVMKRQRLEDAQLRAARLGY